MRIKILTWLCLAVLIALSCMGTVQASEEKVPESASAEAPKQGISLEGMSADETEQLLEKSETFNFQAEVNRMMKLIINSLYKNKEIFLRELISNASDALDKIRFLALTNKDALKDKEELSIRIRADVDKGVLHITDTGIGMTKEHLIKNLGTIARSGTQEFMDALAKGDSNTLIGQFGVGFYSAFLVADSVVVTSKNNEDSEQWVWESDANSFKVFKDPRGDEYRLGRGTTVSLHLKDEAKELLKEANLRELVSKYSQFINFPIYLYTTKEVEVEVEDDEDKLPNSEEDDDDVDVETEAKKEKRKEKVSEYEQLNTVKPLWTRSAKDISDEEYNQFYKDAFKESQEPLSWSHFDAEGEISFKSLIYIPSSPPPQVNDISKLKSAVKLFVRKVFITDELDILPRWLSWLKALLDSDDIPLNVSRETLQQSKLIKLMRKKIVRKAIELFKKLADDYPDKFKTFWKNFGSFLKLGVVEQDPNSAKLLKMLQWESSASRSNLTGLDGYISRMKEDQKEIYYLTGLSRPEVESSPLAEKLIKRRYEVLFALDPLDEYVFQNNPEYEGKKFVDVGKQGINVGDEKRNKKVQKHLNKEYAKLNDFLKEQLKEQVEDVTVSTRLEESPCVLVAKSYGLTGTMQKIMRAQSGGIGANPMLDFYLNQKPILEINARHPLIQKMKEDLDVNKGESLKDKVILMYEAAVLRSGYDLKDAPAFAQRIERILRTALGVEHDLPVMPDMIPMDLLEKDDDDEDEDDLKDEELADEPISDDSDADSPKDKEAEQSHDEL